MSYGLIGAFLMFAIVTLFTPGPNNVMLMTTGLNFGLRRAQPHVLGVTLGFAFMVLVVGLGLGAVFSAFPAVYTIIKYAGAAYILYLAWLIGRSHSVEEGEAPSRPVSFVEAVLFQWVNPKGWVMIVGAVTAYAAVAAFPVKHDGHGGGVLRIRLCLEPHLGSFRHRPSPVCQSTAGDPRLQPCHGGAPGPQPSSRLRRFVAVARLKRSAKVLQVPWKTGRSCPAPGASRRSRMA